MPTNKKIGVVKDLTEKLSRAKSVVLTDFQKLTASGEAKLKRALDEKEGEFQVTKNTLLKIALEALPDKEFNELTSNLSGQSAVLFIYEEGFSPLKTLRAMSKETGFPKIKCGVIENKFYSGIEVEKIADLPSKEFLIRDVTRYLGNPLFNLSTRLANPYRKLLHILGVIIKQRG